MKIFRLFACTALALAVMGCSKDRGYWEEPDPEPEQNVGYLDLSAFRLMVTSDVEEIPSIGKTGATRTQTAPSTEATGDYLVTITNDKTGESVFSGSYTDLKAQAGDNQTMELAPSTYTLRARSAGFDAMPAMAWDAPVYSGSKTFSIIKRTTTSLTGDNAVVCKLGNIKTTVSLSADLDKLFKPDDADQQLTTTLTLESAEAVFGRTETRAAFFRASQTTGSIAVRLRGQYNKAAEGETPVYTAVDWKQSIPNCKAGQWRNITITVLNADKGNVQFQLTVETWTYDEKIDVDIARYYSALEEEIPDEEISDPDSPVVTLDGKDIAQPFTLNSSMVDTELGTCSNMLRVVVSPVGGSTVAKLKAVVTSDNADFLAALATAGYADATVELWPAAAAAATPLTDYVAMRESGSDLLALATIKGMFRLYEFTGKHTVKFVAEDSQKRISYTELTINVSHGSSSAEGPDITWRGHDFDTTYSNDGLEVMIDITSATGITGFLVDIDAPDVLPASELETLKLATHMDLIHPADADMEESLRNLGFPVKDEVANQKSLLFDITTFMPMISALNRAGYCNFKLTVTDASGTNVKTIKLNVQP